MAARSRTSFGSFVFFSAHDDTSSDATGTTLLAAKQVYANHYFEAGLELLSIVDREGARGDSVSGVTLVAIRRYSFDNLPSGGPLDLRGRVIDGIRDQMEADLTRFKAESGRTVRPPQTAVAAPAGVAGLVTAPPPPGA